MALDKRKSPKSETLTIRLDPKTRFMLEFVARLRGQTITTVVERAIVDAANNAEFVLDDRKTKVDWRYFWDVSEGVRALKLAEVSKLNATFEEEKRLEFAKYHYPYFYINSFKLQPRRDYVDILWPRIDEFVSVWDETKATEFFKASVLMDRAIRNAGIEPPEWIERANAMTPSSLAALSLDDDLPF